MLPLKILEEGDRGRNEVIAIVVICMLTIYFPYGDHEPS